MKGLLNQRHPRVFQTIINPGSAYGFLSLVTNLLYVGLVNLV